MGKREKKTRKWLFAIQLPLKLKKKYICKVNNLKVFLIKY